MTHRSDFHASRLWRSKAAPSSRRAAVLGSLASLATIPCLRAAPPALGDAIPVEGGPERCVVTVSLDGRPARMLLDTGSEYTEVTLASAARLRLRSDPWVTTELRGAGGKVEELANADARSARIGGVVLTQYAAGVGLSLRVTTADLGGLDGLLAADVLRHYTLDLDMPRGRLALLPPIRPKLAAPAVGLQLWRKDLLLAPVLLDGHRLTACLDTGSAISLINARGAYRLGLKPSGPGPALGIRSIGGVAPAYAHRFGELRIGGLQLPAPTFLVQDVPEGGFDLLLGMDVLARQRFMLSYGDLMLAFG